MIMPSNHAATIGAPIFGLNATRHPATISIAPTIRMKVPAPPTSFPSGEQRYMDHSVSLLKNLSIPATTGAMTKPNGESDMPGRQDYDLKLQRNQLDELLQLCSYITSVGTLPLHCSG